MSLHELLVGSARRHGDRTAVHGAGAAMSYARLDALANAFAHRLRGLGVTRGDRVLIWSAKSAEAVAAMQGALRLGAAYVPAGGAVPAARVALMARDCAARVICAEPGRAAALPSGAAPALLDLGDVAARTAGPPVCEPVEPGELAYILYTSGSTGVPKGVCITHRNARAFVDWAVAELRATPADRFANHAPFTFDLSVLDLYGAFAVGASVHLVPSDLAYAPDQLVDFVYSRAITLWYSVPSALALMIRDGGLLDRPAPAGLRAVVFAGEPFPIDQVCALAAWTPARLLNFYGPTETNVCTYHEVRPRDLARDRPVPIGRAASGDRVWALAADGRVAGPGEEGELVVEGPTVTPGYWGLPRPPGPYRTGDLVRVLDDGSFDYLGRRDHLVKVRGNRVEPGEIEAVLAAHPGIGHCAVVLSGEGLAARLVAFAVPAPGAAAPSVLEVKRHCAQRLPTYMIVDEVHIVAELPRTPNGKVDRAALLERANGGLVAGRGAP